MREIKFRARRLSNGDFVYGFYTLKPRDNGIGYIHIIQEFACDNEMRDVPIDIKTLGQLTGLKDINGVEIYSGDIIKFVDHNYENYPKKYSIVEFGSNDSFCGFGTKDYIYKSLNGYEKYEVLGNVFENKELLEK